MSKGKQSEKPGGPFRPIRTTLDAKPPYRPISCHGCGAYDVTLYAVCGLALCPKCKPIYEPFLIKEQEAQHVS
jgi:hypothetical protein